MKPSFALNLAHDGIDLLHRAGSGWVTVGTVSLDEPDLTAAMAGLRARARALEPKGMTSKLILPASQILYTRIHAPGPDAASRRSRIAQALEGMTPYAVADLVFDWSGTGDEVQVAVVARDTLAEAEAFAETYGFCPLCLVASPDPGQFGGEPFFGLTTGAAQHLPEGARLDRDQDPVRLPAPPLAPAAPDADLAASPDPVPPPPPAAEAEAEADPVPVQAAEVDVIGSHGAARDTALPEAALPETAPADPTPPEPAPQPQEPVAAPGPSAPPVITFASRRTAPEGDASAAPAAPRLGAATRPPAADADAPLPRLRLDTGSPTVLAPAIDLPDPAPAPGLPPETPASAPRLAATAARPATGATGATGATDKTPRPATPTPATPPTAAKVPPAASDRTVFGGRRLAPPAARNRHLGLMLTLGLVLFLLIVAIWSMFLGGPRPDAPTPVAEAADSLPPKPQTAPDPAQPEAQAIAVPPAAQTDLAEAATDEAATVIATMDADDEGAPVAAAPAPEPAAAAPATVLAETAAAAAAAPPDEVWGDRGAPEPALRLAAISTADPRPVSEETGDLAALTPPPPDARPDPLPTPAPFGQLARLGPGGEIIPTPQGVAMPGGFTLFAGRPPVTSAPRPEAVQRAALAPEAETDTAPPAEAETAPYADPALAGFKPQGRPAAIANRAPDLPPEAETESAAPAAPEDDGAALAPEVPVDPRLAARAPRARPATVASAAAEARAAQQATEDALRAASPQAVTVARRPADRPGTIVAAAAAAASIQAAAVEAAVAAAVATPVAAPAAAPAPAPRAAAAQAPAPPPEEEDELDEPEVTAPAPKLPTSASVAKQATQANALNLGKINLIGLYGANKNRRALVRMPNGKFVKVGIGDRLDGGRVTAIGTNQLTYQKNGRNYVLEMLKGS
ncbi:hypothetical protein [Phaeovulum sp. NW3]|uniref:hypothetical protein n=1 Tax=Phaeovulum sp. NW3 TaxID=2934933 RepID=UPI0020213CBD|nr:hypothetical protein [Phaeovulum sp. NW3]MCL7464948.1 hypothetical protein [Phaeovulum sp. NW3]